MIQALWNLHKTKMFLIRDPALQLHCTKPKFTSTLTTQTNMGVSIFQVVEQNGNGYNRLNFAISEDVRTLCNQGRLKQALHILHFIDPRGTWPDFYTYASLLQGCVNMKALTEGKLVHAHMVETRFKPDVFLETKLVIMYTKCRSLVNARRVLDEMPERNVVTWTAMITAYAKYGHCDEALTLYSEMQQTGIQPNEFTFSSVLVACANLAALEHGKEVHEDVIRSGFQCNIFVGGSLVDMYVKCRRLEDARKVFDKMPEGNVVSWTAMIAGYAQNGDVDEALKLFEQMPERNVVSWTAMIAGYTQNGHFDGALELFRQMQLTEVKSDSDFFASVLPALANLAALQRGREVHEDIIRTGFQSNVFVGSALIDMYAKCGSIEDARRVFDKMPERNVVSWTAMIVGYAMHGCGREALQLFQQMQRSGMKPNLVTFVGVLSACCHAGLVDDGYQYFDRMCRDYHLTPEIEHYCCMVDLLGRAGLLNEAHDFINKMPIKPNATVWVSLLAACRVHTNVELAERVSEHLFVLDPENATHYVLLSNIYAAAGRWDDIQKVRQLMKDRGVKKTPGCSRIEVNNKVYSFVVGDTSHPQTLQIYAKLETLSGEIKEAGYVPDTNFALQNVEEEQKEHILCHHSEKLAIAFGLINTYPGTPIRIVKNLRVCGDCHSAIKFISKIVARKIVVRDANRFHHFIDGECSCGDYW
eukprot:Gb_30991 [translate_table: standard]